MSLRVFTVQNYFLIFVNRKLKGVFIHDTLKQVFNVKTYKLETYLGGGAKVGINKKLNNYIEK